MHPHLAGQSSVWKRVASITLGAAIAGTILYFALPSHKKSPIEAQALALKAIMQDGGGISKDTGFILTSSKGAISVDDVKTSLKTTPEISLAYKQKSSNEIEISPQLALSENRVYGFAVQGSDQMASWAFQVKGPFHIVGSIPENRMNDIPLNTGIEITFTHEKLKDPEKYISITPSVKGRFEVHKKTIVFVPEKHLSPKTVYAITVKKGLGVENTDLSLQNDQTISFETSGDQPSSGYAYFETESSMMEFSPTQDQFIPVNMSSELEQELTALSPTPTTQEGESNVATGEAQPSPSSTPPTLVNVTAYSIPDAELFSSTYLKLLDTTYWATFNRYQVQDLIKKSSHTEKFQAPIIHPQRYQNYVQLPQKLSKGLYLIALSHPRFEDARYVWVQVTNVAAYARIQPKQGIAWVNNGGTGAPEKNATLRFSDGSKFSTDTHGLASFETPKMFTAKDDESTHKLIRESRTKASALTITTTQGESLIVFIKDFVVNPQDPYISYLSTSRPVYATNDTVRLFGLIKPKTSNVKPLTKAKLRVTSSSGFGYMGYMEESESGNVISEKEISLSPTGIISEEIPLNNIPTGWYSLRIIDPTNNKEIITKGFSIESYVKPAYDLRLELSKEKAFVGDTINITTRAQFFEGTPVPNKNIKLVINGYALQSADVKLTTDASGRASFPFKVALLPGSEKNEEYWPKILSVSASVESNEVGEISAYSNFMVFNSNIITDTTVSQGDKTKTVTLKAYTIDLTKDDNKGAPLRNAKFDVLTEKTVYKKTPNGVEYDFINKTTIEHYDYTQEKSVTGTGSVTTDTNGMATYTAQYNPEESLRAKFSTTAPNGKLFTDWTYLYSNYSGAGDNYDLQLDKTNGLYAFGEDEWARIYKNGMPASQGNYLFIIGSDSGIDTQIQTDSALKFKFLERFAPTAQIKAIRFTGKTYDTIGFSLLRLDTEKEKKLEIEIKADKPEYKPGEKVTLKIMTRKNGSPVASDVNISLVDQAYIKIYSVSPDPLSSLYAGSDAFWYNWNGGIFEYASHRQGSYPIGGGGGAEGGGGGSENRNNFKDEAYFGTIQTNSNGEGTATFSLPDNLTSWQIAAQGVDTQLNAGAKLQDLKVKLPFFIDAIVAHEYLEQDKPIVQIRAYGEQLKAGDTVNVKISSTSLKMPEKSYQVKAYSTLDIPLNALTNGKHSITFSGVSNGLSDKLTQSFTVIPSRLASESLMTQKIKEGDNVLVGDFANAKGWVHVTIQETEKARMYENLWNFATRGGTRFDQLYVQKRANELLQSAFNEKDLPGSISGNTSMEDLYQAGDGGIKLIPYGSSDLKTSFLAAVLAQKDISQESLTRYFGNIINEEGKKNYPKDTRERYLTAVSGLAALHQPVLLLLQDASQIKDLTPKEKLILALGAMGIGDQGLEMSLTQDVLKDKGEKLNPYLRVNIGKDNDDILESTSLALVLAGDLNMPEKEELLGFISEQPGKDVLTSLEMLSYIEKRVPFVSKKEAKVAYEIAEKKEDGGSAATSKYTLKNGEALSFDVLPQNVGQLRITQANGDLSITLRAQTPKKAEDLKKDTSLALARNYKVNGKVAKEIHVGDIVHVELMPKMSAKAVEGCYTVTEYLPSGLAFLPWGDPTSKDRWFSWPSLADGQKIAFCTGKNPKQPLNFSARVVNKGLFIAEPATVQSALAPGAINSTDASAIEVK